MSLLSWLPGAFKDLLRHVPTLLFDVVSWNALLKDATTLSKRMLTQEGAAEAREALAPQLPPGLSFSDQPLTPPATPEARRLLGEKILALYFVQVHSGTAMFLDMRLTGFGLTSSGIGWNPTTLWASFSPLFRTGVQELYAGFYLQDALRFERGLLHTGLIAEHWAPHEKERMASLFRAHFGQAIEAPMRFELAGFQHSFQAVFQFLLEKKVQLTTDFLLLGVMLVTLYLALEELGGEYPVAKIYRSSTSQGAA